MIISKFIKELHSINPNWLIATNSNEEIYSYKAFPSMEELQNNILYIGRLSGLTSISNEGIMNFLLIDDQEGNYDTEQLQFALSNCNLVITTAPIQFQSFCKLASDIFLAEIRYTSYVNHMVVALNKNKGLSYLVDEVFKLIKNPIVIIDTSYKVLAMYHGLRIEARPDLDAQRELGGIPS